jgi:hypothetical protein
MFRHSNRASQIEVDRLESLMSSLEPGKEEQQGIDCFQKALQRADQFSVALDGGDPESKCAPLLYCEG